MAILPEERLNLRRDDLDVGYKMQCSIELADVKEYEDKNKNKFNVVKLQLNRNGQPISILCFTSELSALKLEWGRDMDSWKGKLINVEVIETAGGKTRWKVTGVTQKVEA